MQGKVIYDDQKQVGRCVWTGIPSYMTVGFKSVFGDDAELIASAAVELILQNHPHKAGYFQKFRYIWADGKETKFLLINDVDHYTVLLPSER